jgi:hypothetical protein
MSYRIKRGAFAVGIVNSGQNTGAQTLTKLSIDSIRTSAGLFHSTKLFMSGLAFSDTYFYDTGGASNFMPNASHSPAPTGGFGFDNTDGYSAFYGAGAVGCAKYTDNELAIYYYERNDQNHSVDSSICVVF